MCRFAGEFDRTNQSADGLIYVIEAKGGSGQLGGRKATDGRFVQQGTREYFDIIVQSMTNNGKPELECLAQTISTAEQSNKVEYWLVRQDFNADNTLKSILANKFY